MSAAKIQSALEKAFAQRRVVFWYDQDGEWWPEFEAMQLPEVDKVSVQNTEFTVKHRIAREQPAKKFLLYFRSQAQPVDTANWLLDQLLAYGPAFSPDRASLALIDAGLPPEFKSLTERHLEFFRSSERVSRLKEWLAPDDSEQGVRLKMIAVICKSQPAVETILLILLTDLGNNREERFALIEKHGLSSAWWQEIASQFGYVATQASLKDFVLSLFRAVAPLGGASSLDVRQSLIFFNRWKDSQEHRETFEVLSDQTARSLNISAALNQVDDIGALLENDTYRLIDQKILTYLRDGLMDGCLAPSLVCQRAEQRERLHWARYDVGIQALYRTLATAAEFIDLLPKLDFSIESFDAGLEKYAATWWRMDQLYRKFIFYVGESSQPTLLGALAARIEGLYVNEYLSKLAYRWQEWVDRLEQWSSATTPSQRSFFNRFVQPHLGEGKKVFVIVSDALRYEAARELLDRILAQDRWTGEMKFALGSLPSFTQLGMAALLPQSSLELSKDGQTVLADGVSTVGTEARAQILSRHLGGRGTAVRAEEFLAMNSKTEGRDLSKANDVVFIYHNEIDAVGDKRDTEHRTCVAVESALENLIKILKKAAAMNVSHMVVTADHGFLYQHEPVAESDFLNSPQVSDAVKNDRRFIVTANLSQDPNLRNFTAAQLGLKGAGHLSFPKGTLRMRLQGSGSRYVHGGTSLQEVVVPVIEVKKERASDVGAVQVDILRSSQQITTGQVTVTFLQSEPVSEKCLGRELRAAFYSKTDVPLSDIKVLTFAASDEDARLRERSERFIFSRAADAFNQQDVILRLAEQVPGTTQFAPYKEFGFRLRRAFESDFDDL